MFGFKSISGTRHEKGQEYITHNAEENQAIETNPKLPQLLFLRGLQNFLTIL